MGSKLDINVGDVYDCWQVQRQPERINGSKHRYCWCKCIKCNKVEKYVRCSDLKNHMSHCVCCRKTKYNIVKPQKLKTISFEEWCINNNRQDLLDRWDYSLNKYTPDQISFKSKYRIYFKCPLGKHDSRDLILQSITINNNPCNCKECYFEMNSFGRWCEDNDLDILDLWDYDKNDKSPYEIAYGSNQKFYFKCQRGLHESYLKTISDITLRQNHIICKKCNSIGQWIIDNYNEQYLNIIWDYDKNIKSPFEVSCGSSRGIIFLKCFNNSSHPSYPISPSNFTKGRGCPACKCEMTESRLQSKVKKYISKTYGYRILHEYACDLKPINPKTGYILPYDNQVIIDSSNNLIVEVMGVQHYQITGYTKLEAEKHNISPKDELFYQQWKDAYKKDYALSQGYHYLEIPYWTEKDESYKTLIDNKIHEILTLTQQND